MDILHVCPSKSFSGLEQYAFEVASDQHARGKSVGFVVYPGSRLEKECHALGIKTIPYLYDALIGNINFWLRLNKIFKEEANLRVVHLHMTSEVNHLAVPLFWNRIGKTSKFKIILQIHIWLNHKKKDPLHWLLYSNIDKVWCSSVPARESLIKNLPISSEKIKIINYGRDILKLKAGFLSRSEARKNLDLPEDHLVLATVSRIEEGKGIRELVEGALPFLKQNQKLDLVIIGAASPNNPLAEKYTADLKSEVMSLEPLLRNRIKFKGSLPDSYKYLKAFDLYILPSYEECFSLSLLDAQLAQLPVVGTDTGGTPEIVKEGVTGWLFHPRDALALQNKLGEALKNQNKWSDYGAHAKTRVEKEFDKTQIFEKIISNYNLEDIQ